MCVVNIIFVASRAAAQKQNPRTRQGDIFILKEMQLYVGFMCLFLAQLENAYKEKINVIFSWKQNRVGSLWEAVNRRLSTLLSVGCADVGLSLKIDMKRNVYLPRKYVHLTRAVWRAEKRSPSPFQGGSQPAAGQQQQKVG